MWGQVYTTYIYDQAKSDEPQDRDENVDGPVDKASGEGEKPDNGEEDSQTGDHFRIDEATLLPTIGVADRVEIGAVKTSDNGGEDQLRNAEDHRK